MDFINKKWQAQVNHLGENNSWTITIADEEPSPENFIAWAVNEQVAKEIIRAHNLNIT